jgi:hypothetical protein
MIEITDEQHIKNIQEYQRLMHVVDGYFVRTNSQIDYLSSSGKEFIKFYNNFRRGNKLNKDAMKLELEKAEKVIESGEEYEPSIFCGFVTTQLVQDKHRALYIQINKITKDSADMLAKQADSIEPKEYYLLTLEEVRRIIPSLEKLVDDFEQHFEKVVEANDNFKIENAEAVNKYWP